MREVRAAAAVRRGRARYWSVQRVIPQAAGRGESHPEGDHPTVSCLGPLPGSL